jgi:hypothetical protein
VNRVAETRVPDGEQTTSTTSAAPGGELGATIASAVAVGSSAGTANRPHPTVIPNITAPTVIAMGLLMPLTPVAHA